MAPLGSPALVMNRLFIGRNGNGDLLSGELTGAMPSGALIALIGPNGCGKTTLIKILAGLLKPISGEVHYGNTLLQDINQKELALKRALVLTERPHIAYMTGLDMVLLGRSPYTGLWGTFTERDKEIARQALSQTGAERLEKREFIRLSDGEKQKVLLARSLSQQTPLIFLDEPTAFLDAGAKGALIDLLKSIARKTNTSVLFSTHDLKPALQHSDALWIMKKDKRFSIEENPKKADEEKLLREVY